MRPSLRFFSWIVSIFALLLAVQGGTQVRRPVSAPQENDGFGTKFFDELRSLFGRLRQSDLDLAFERGKAIRCSDLVGESGEWKVVGFLNSDPKLGNWHFDSIEDVKTDLTKFVFSGDCRSEASPLTVASSYPVQETVNRFNLGRIPLSQVVINDNAPVRVSFDQPADAYVFELPYLYLDNKASATPLYTLAAPLTTSKPVRGLGIEFRCKSVSDVDKTYLFLLCHTHLVDHSVPAPRQSQRQPLGNTAYYILSDGKEASSSVKLVFGNENAAVPEPRSPASPEAPVSKPAKVDDSEWQPAVPTAMLFNIGDREFRLRFNPQSWKDRITKPQLLSNQALSDFAGFSAPARNQQYCVWRPIQLSQVNALLDTRAEDPVYTLRLTKNSRSPTTAIFEVENDRGQSLSSLQCYFPQSQTPEDVTVERWLSIVGTHIQIQVRRQ